MDGRGGVQRMPAAGVPLRRRPMPERSFVFVEAATAGTVDDGRYAQQQQEERNVKQTDEGTGSRRGLPAVRVAVSPGSSADGSFDGPPTSPDDDRSEGDTSTTDDASLTEFFAVAGPREPFAANPMAMPKGPAEPVGASSHQGSAPQHHRLRPPPQPQFGAQPFYEHDPAARHAHLHHRQSAMLPVLPQQPYGPYLPPQSYPSPTAGAVHPGWHHPMPLRAPAFGEHFGIPIHHRHGGAPPLDVPGAALSSTITGSMPDIYYVSATAGYYHNQYSLPSANTLTQPIYHYGIDLRHNVGIGRLPEPVPFVRFVGEPYAPTSAIPAHPHQLQAPAAGVAGLQPKPTFIDNGFDRRHSVSLPADIMMPNSGHGNLVAAASAHAMHSEAAADLSFFDADTSLHIDVSAILAGVEHRTTVMIRNVPNRFKQRDILTYLRAYIPNGYDVVYLPIDFRLKNNLGYCFVNVRESSAIVSLVSLMHKRAWPNTRSTKVCFLRFARTQGREALIEHYQHRTRLLNLREPSWRPLVMPALGDRDNSQRTAHNIKSSEDSPSSTASLSGDSSA